MSELHVLHQDIMERIVLSKTRTTKDGLTLLTSEKLQDVTDEALRAVASYLLAKARKADQDWYGLVYGLRDGKELQLQVHIKEAEE